MLHPWYMSQVRTEHTFLSIQHGDFLLQKMPHSFHTIWSVFCISLFQCDGLIHSRACIFPTLPTVAPLPYITVQSSPRNNTSFIICGNILHVTSSTVAENKSPVS